MLMNAVFVLGAGLPGSGHIIRVLQILQIRNVCTPLLTLGKFRLVSRFVCGFGIEVGVGTWQPYPQAFTSCAFKLHLKVKKNKKKTLLFMWLVYFVLQDPRPNAHTSTGAFWQAFHKTSTYYLYLYLFRTHYGCKLNNVFLFCSISTMDAWGKVKFSTYLFYLRKNSYCFLR